MAASRGGVTLPESDSKNNIATMSNRTGTVATALQPRVKRPRTTSPSRDYAQSDSRPLDGLPLEILLEIASYLDWGSLRSLGCASRRCRDAVSSHLGRLSVFHVRWSDLEGVVKTSADLAVLLLQMTSLRKLHVESCLDSKRMLEVLVACLWCWPLLETLNLDLDEYPTDLLKRFCAGCEKLNEVTLGEHVNDQAVDAVLTGRPDLLALDVSYGPVFSVACGPLLRGDFFARLPAKLRRLAVDCSYLRSSAVRELARCGELRSLQLEEARGLRQEDVAAGLGGCVRLERLILECVDEPVIGCVPPAGLPALRCLQLSFATLTDSDLEQMVLRLPNLQSICLKNCGGSTQHGLAQLGQLTALTSLSLVKVEGVSDWALALLSVARLTELRLSDDSEMFAESITAEGLLRLTQTCPSLRKITLWHDELHIKSAKCGPGTDEGYLLEWLRTRLPYTGGITIPESDSCDNMAAMDDRTGAVTMSPEPQLRPRTTEPPSRGRAQPGSRPLDGLPLEILMEIASYLDWGSLRSLLLTSRRCRDAVSSHLGRLRVFHLRWSYRGHGVVKTSADLTVLLAQMKSLQKLTVGSLLDPKDVLEALVACVWKWPLLEVLNLQLDEYPTDLLERFCASCMRLTDVTLGHRIDEQAVEAVLAGRPDLLALDVADSDSLRGDFLARLPAKLRRLEVNCDSLSSSAVTELASCGELRSLELFNAGRLRREDLTISLAGCVRLEKLLLGFLDGPFIDCLPPAGLPSLRCLELSIATLSDSDLQRLVLRLPNLQSICLDSCHGSTQHGLALLRKLPALTSLGLLQTDGVSDWALAQLSSTRLTELRLGVEGAAFAASVTAEGLLRFSQTCPSLRKISLWYDYAEIIGSYECGPGTDDGSLLEWLRDCLPEVTD